MRDTLLNHGDSYMHLADLTSYLHAHESFEALYADPGAWPRKAVLNIAALGEILQRPHHRRVCRRNLERRAVPRAMKISMKATHLLQNLGQSIWLDNITRDLLDNGTLIRYIDEFAVTGLTSNPTIFERAMGSSRAYDVRIQSKMASGNSAERSLLRTRTGGSDPGGRPVPADPRPHQHSRRLGVARSLAPARLRYQFARYAPPRTCYERASRPNLFIKIPGTNEGLPAVEEAIFAGIPVNVTLLFSREQYLAAAEAFLRGIERRLQAGLNPNVASVASIFVSRWDAAVVNEVPSGLRNQLGIAVAKRIYRRRSRLTDVGSLATHL